VIETLTFGRTGHESARTIFGAAALSQSSQEEADHALELLLDYGINHIDVAASYGDAELHVGRWMREHRRRFFLATKTGGRSYSDAWEDLHRSLDRLQTGHVDLWQLHNLVDAAEWDVALSPNGAIDAAVEAREQGLVRFIGVTGHGSSVAAQHRRSLDRFDFDSVLLPYSHVMMQNSHYFAEFDRLMDICVQRNIGVQTIKSIATGPWLGEPHTLNTWYKPLEEQRDIDLAVHWVLGRPGIFLNTVSNVGVLEKVLTAADRFESIPSEEQMAELTNRLEMTALFV
jgi:aryl-alcohol dehydrogenase-like predicted oxidoreductase